MSRGFTPHTGDKNIGHIGDVFPAHHMASIEFLGALAEYRKGMWLDRETCDAFPERLLSRTNEEGKLGGKNGKPNS